MSGVDVLYLAWNRLAFSQFTFPALLDNTDWELVNHLHVYDDGSEDGTAEYLAAAIDASPVPSTFHPCGFRSPVETMNHYLEADPAPLFAKIDSDIAVPPGWLTVMAGVLERHPRTELLGMEPGRMGVAPADWDGIHRPDPARWIGGVGLMRSSAFTGRRRLAADGRHGFTQFQQEYRTASAWVTPDIPVFSMDQLPFDPWKTLAREYVEVGWARPWPAYYPSSTHLWDWAFPT